MGQNRAIGTAARHERRACWVLGQTAEAWVAKERYVATIFLLCSACVQGASLDTPAEEYIAAPTTTSTGPLATSSTGGGGTTSSDTGTQTSSVTTTDGVATTGAVVCGDFEVDQIFNESCAHKTCHGTPGAPPTGSSDLFLFSETREADFLRLGTACPNESIIDTANPAASLLITVLLDKAACGKVMPSPFQLLAPEKTDCVAEWVQRVANNAVAAGM